MRTFFKILSIGGILIGLAGAGFGIYAAMNPQGAVGVMQLVDMEAVAGYLGIGIPIFVIGIMILAFSPLIMGSIKNSQNKKRLMQIGTRAKATIVAVRDTGITMNNAPYAEIHLKLQDGTMTTIKTFVSRVSLPQIGASVEILYDPANPKDAIFAPV